MIYTEKTVLLKYKLK